LHVGDTEVYHAFTYNECLSLVDDAGWPLLAGLYTRVKF
jgi:hypothetical protein